MRRLVQLGGLLRQEPVVPRLPDVAARLRLDDAHPRHVRAQLPVAGPLGELVELDGDHGLSGELVGPVSAADHHPNMA